MGERKALVLDSMGIVGRAEKKVRGENWRRKKSRQI